MYVYSVNESIHTTPKEALYEDIDTLYICMVEIIIEHVLLASCLKLHRTKYLKKNYITDI